jgi:hypothetical protein
LYDLYEINARLGNGDNIKVIGPYRSAKIPESIMQKYVKMVQEGHRIAEPEESAPEFNIQGTLTGRFKSASQPTHTGTSTARWYSDTPNYEEVPRDNNRE